MPSRNIQFANKIQSLLCKTCLKRGGGRLKWIKNFVFYRIDQIVKTKSLLLLYRVYYYCFYCFFFYFCCWCLPFSIFIRGDISDFIHTEIQVYIFFCLFMFLYSFFVFAHVQNSPLLLTNTDVNVKERAQMKMVFFFLFLLYIYIYCPYDIKEIDVVAFFQTFVYRMCVFTNGEQMYGRARQRK